MTSSWIPAPAAVVWLILFAAVVIVHVAHFVALSGRHRLWHLGHVLMAAGMVTMLWPTGSTMLVPARYGVVVYLAAAGLLASSLVVARSRRLALGPLWLVNGADLLWMAYMFALMSTRLAWLSILGAIWFGVQTVGWAGGRLGRVLESGGLGAPQPVGPRPLTRALQPVGPRPVTGAPQHTVRTAGPRDGERRGSVAHDPTDADDACALPDTAAIHRTGVVDGGRRDWSVRISLAVMALGMAYMLLAMQFGTATMSGSSGGMPGM